MPIGLAGLLGLADVQHIHTLGWSGASDETLIDRAVEAGFEVMVTTDQSLPFQQTLQGLALIVIDTNNWNMIRAHAAEIRTGITASCSGRCTKVSIMRRFRGRPPA